MGLSKTVKLALLLAAFSPALVLAKSTLITNIDGYTIANNELTRFTAIAVSYTHLTLPTNREV